MPVKLQVVNLAVKMYLPNPLQTKLISQYVFNLAKFDQNYDLRDRARFIRAILSPQGEPGKISKHAKMSPIFSIEISTSWALCLRATGRDQANHDWLDSWSRRIFKVNKLGNV